MFVLSVPYACGGNPSPQGGIFHPPEIEPAWIENAREDLWHCFAKKNDPDDTGCGRNEIECRKVLEIRKDVVSSFEESSEGCKTIIEPTCFKFRSDKKEVARCYASAVGCEWALVNFPPEVKAQYRDFTKCMTIATQKGGAP